MKNYLLILSLLIGLTLTVSAQDKSVEIKLSGDVGGYNIEMIINSVNVDSSSFEGKYKYLSQKNYLDIKGINYGSCIYIEEFYNQKQTGSFYLERDGDSLSGYWANIVKSFPVKLKIVAGTKDLLNIKTELDYLSLVSNDIRGRYEVSTYFINDFFTSEDNQSYEIGYNGGYVDVVELGDGEIKFEFEFLCGPTYHFATGEGVAFKQDDVYIYKEDLYQTGEFCEIIFKFGEKSLSVAATNSSNCDFGARAYVDHELFKVKNY